MIQTREYQDKGIENAWDHLYVKGYNGTIIHNATGLGKSVTAAEFIHRKFDLHKQRVMFVVHTTDLIIQAYYDFLEVHPEWERNAYTMFGRAGIGICMGARYNQPDARIIVGTPQTLSGREGTTERLEEILSYGDIDLLIIDECHYAASQSYLNLARRLGKNCKRLGLTATPMRSDGLALRQPLGNDLGMMFDSICISRNIKWGVANDYLCPIRPPLLIETNIALPDGRGDIDMRSRMIDVSNWAELVVDAYIQYGEDRIGIYFLPSIEHSREVCKEFNARGIPSFHSDHKELMLPDGTLLRNKAADDAMRDIFDDWLHGRIRLGCNYNKYVHGLNIPSIALIGLARPTDSPVVITQAIGRGTRKHPTKKDLLVLDYALKDVPLLLSGSLLGYTWDEKSKEMIEDPEAEIETLSDGVNLLDIRSENELVDGNGVVTKIGNLFRQKSEAWYNGGDSLSLSLAQDKTLLVTFPNYTLASSIQIGLQNGREFLIENPDNDNARQFYKNLQAASNLASNYVLWYNDGDKVYQLNSANSIDVLFDHAITLIEKFEDPVLSNKKKSWRRQPATDKQIALIRGWGDKQLLLSKGEAAQIITHNFAYRKIRPLYNETLRLAGKYGIVN